MFVNCCNNCFDGDDQSGKIAETLRTIFDTCLSYEL